MNRAVNGKTMDLTDDDTGVRLVFEKQ